MYQPTISIIVPVAEGRDTSLLLKSIEQLDYPSELIEIIFVFGNHPTKQRNEAYLRASGELLYFLDNDSEPDSKNLKHALPHFNEKRVVAVAGPALPKPQANILQKSVDKLFSSFLGTGSARARHSKQSGPRVADTNMVILCNFIIRKETFKSLGLFNELLFPGEENDLARKIIYNGYRIIYDPNFYVTRSHRSNLNDLTLQIFRDGRGRADYFFIKPDVKSIFFFLPLLFYLYVFVSTFIFFIGFYEFAADKLILVLPQLIYFFTVCGFSLFSFIAEQDLTVALLLIFLYPYTHFCYSMGQLWGIIKNLIGKRGYIRPDYYFDIKFIKKFEGKVEEEVEEEEEITEEKKEHEKPLDADDILF